MAADPGAEERLIGSDVSNAETPQSGVVDPLWTTTDYVVMRHPYATPHVPVQPLSTVS